MSIIIQNSYPTQKNILATELGVTSQIQLLDLVQVQKHLKYRGLSKTAIFLFHPVFHTLKEIFKIRFRLSNVNNKRFYTNTMKMRHMIHTVQRLIHIKCGQFQQ